MGADEKSILKKCGEILINVKAKNKKNKIYTFMCAFCDANCDQLKKFSLHLEEEHLPRILQKSEGESLVKVTEIKEEQLNAIEVKADVQTIVCIPRYEDPLDTKESVAPEKIEDTEILMEVEIKEEEIKQQSYTMDYEGYNSNNDELGYEDCFADDNDVDYSNNDSSDSEYKDVQSYKLRERKKVQSLPDLEANVNKSKTKETKKRLKKNDSNTNGADEKEICIALFEALEKQPNLWVIKKRSNKNRINKQYFEIIANEVNDKLKTNFTWEDAKVRIRKMRNQYAIEMQKKDNGEEYEFPWYAEHMKFLQDNLQDLLKVRKGLKKYTPLKTMDESELSILIDVYKSYDSLWQVNDIAHGAKRKRDEIFEKIVEDLKLKYNLPITIDNLHRRVNYMLRIYSENKMLHLKSELEKGKFKPSTELYEKMSFLSDCQGPFKCSYCSEIIDRYDSYQVHLAKHTDTIPFSCPLCAKTFRKYNSYMIHARRHMEINKHFCKYCDRGFPTTTELALHERSHTGEYPYLCQICGASFKAPHSYDSHIRRHENRFRYNCHICNHGFNHSHQLRDHVKAHLNVRDKVCNICGKTFTATKRLRYHQLIHSGEKNYKCKVCGKAFAQNAGLRQHRKQHEPFSAQYKKDSSLNLDS